MSCYINPDILDKFNRNALTKDELTRIETEMLHHDIANASLATLRQEYYTRTDINNLIGEDEETDSIWPEIDKIIDNRCEKKDVHVSIETNTKIQNNMNNMKISTEDMAKVAKRCKSIKSVHESGMTLSENLTSAYMAARPELTYDEAKETIGKLLKGCEELTRKYNQAITEGLNAEAEITALTKNMDVETRFNYLINALAAVEALNANTFDTQKEANEIIKKAIEDYTTTTPNPTDSDCDTIQKLLIEAISNNTLLLTGMEKAQELLAAAKDTDTVIDFTSNQYDDARTKAEMALAMWIEYEDGNLPSIKAGATPESIGIGAATAVEEAKIMNDVATGRTTADIAVKCLKILGGVALFLLLGYLGIIIAATVGGLAAAALLSVFGTSTIACIATMVICLPLLWGLAQLGVDTGAYILDKAGQAFDYVVEKFRESVFPKIKELTSKIIAWFKSKLGGSQTTTGTVVAMT